MSGTIHIACLSEALAPVTHMQGKAGNESLIATEEFTTPEGKRVVPYLSGNAIRHRMIRRPGWLWLIEEYGLTGRLAPLPHNFLINGGRIVGGDEKKKLGIKDAGGKEDTSQTTAWRRVSPLGALLGGSLTTHPVSGSLCVWRGNLVCEDNRSTLARTLPAALPDKLPPAMEFVGGYQYTRGDVTGATDNMMIYSGSAVNRGAVFAHGFAIKAGGQTDLELGALLWSLRLWQRDDGTFGGMSGRGHGRLRLSIHVQGIEGIQGTPGIDQDALCQRYVEYCRRPQTQEAFLAWLDAAFPGGVLAAPSVGHDGFALVP